MIVKMKKVTVLCLENDKDVSLHKLQDLGILHPELDEKQESEDRAKLEQLAGEVERSVGLLSTRNPAKDIAPIDVKDGKVLADRVEDLLKQHNELSKEVDVLKRDVERLKPWGDFSQELIEQLREKGLHVYLCSGNQDALDAIPDDVTTHIVSEEKGVFSFAAISRTEFGEGDLPLASVPTELGLSEALAKIESCKAKLAEIDVELDGLKASLPVLLVYQQQMQEKLEFAHARDGMSQAEDIAHITGYIPVDAVDGLKQAALENGWALLLVDPSDDDDVPTLLRVPKIFEISKPIFNFIGISPGYHEWDVSTCFLIFFTIFFGMIVSDAGYGLIFLVLALICKFAFKSRPEARLPVNLFIVLSLATIVWGFLSFTWFGLEPEKLSWMPEWMRGIKPLTDPEVKNKNLQYFCFLLAAVHLSFARVWKAVLAANLKSLGELGWGMLIWANFFTAVELIVFQGTFPKYLGIGLYGVGFLFILLFSVNWRDIGDVLNFPFGLIGSFVDVLSYIRLFAVGLSTYYIAYSFNLMGGMLANASDSKILLPFLIIAATVVILLGHLLNIALALMGVLVHGIRLNTLEFSNHMGLQWVGIMYKPFKKSHNETINEEK